MTPQIKLVITYPQILHEVQDFFTMIFCLEIFIYNRYESRTLAYVVEAI